MVVVVGCVCTGKIPVPTRTFPSLSVTQATQCRLVCINLLSDLFTENTKTYTGPKTIHSQMLTWPRTILVLRGLSVQTILKAKSLRQNHKSIHVCLPRDGLLEAKARHLLSPFGASASSRV